MINIRRSLCLAVVGLLGLGLLAHAGESATTVYLVRHAEKQKGSDPSLTEAGGGRAETLARVLSDAGIQAVYSTQFARTRETATPVAVRLGLQVTITPIEGGLEPFVAAFTDRLAEEHAGQSVLVVGHSNTLPALIKALGVADAPSLTEEDYDDLFVVTVGKLGGTRLMHLHYGTASP